MKQGGEGPDILYVDGKDLSALWEKGVLLNLQELVSQIYLSERQ